MEINTSKLEDKHNGAIHNISNTNSTGNIANTVAAGLAGVATGVAISSLVENHHKDYFSNQVPEHSVDLHKEREDSSWKGSNSYKEEEDSSWGSSNNSSDDSWDSSSGE